MSAKHRSSVMAVCALAGSLLLPDAASADCTNCVTTNVGGDVVHTWTADGTFTAPAGVASAQYLVIGGGGGGGAWRGGGGGAGGMLTGTTAVSGTIAVDVGAGGAGAPGGTTVQRGSDGESSSFGSITASGGGGGGLGTNSGNGGGSGGSGGGAGGAAPAGSQAPGTGTGGQGNNGGDSFDNNSAAPRAGGGGGGAGAVGQNAGNAQGGNGGAGASNSITGASVTYAGGGGGASNGGGAGTGGSGGGGNGITNADGQDGTDGLGGGGGGAGGGFQAANAGGAGGDGIVIVRYTPPPARYAVASGNWSAASTWSSASCAGASGASVPAAGVDVTICAGRTVTLNTDSANLGTLTIESTGVLDIGNDSTARTLTVAGAVANAGTLRYNTAAAHAANFGATLANSGTITSAAVGGSKSLTVSGLITNTGTFRFAGTAAMTVTASGGITNGSVLDVSAASNVTHALNVGGDFTNNGTVNFTPDVDSLVDVTFNGGAAQNLTGSTGSTTFNNLTLNNANGLTLSGTHDATVNGTLALTAGLLTTGANVVHVTSGNAVAGAGASTFVVGNLRKRYTTTGTVARTFEVGTISGGVRYAPVAATFGNVTGTGDFTVSTTQGDHPNIATSTLESTLSINRYWTLANDSLTFAAHAATSIAFTFIDPGDYDTGVDFSSLYAAVYDGATWSELMPTARTATTVTLSGTGITTANVAGDYQLGERNVPLSSALADYRMEQTAWSGTVDEVEDSSGNNRHGTANGGATTANATPAVAGDPGTCRYGVFDGTDDYVQVANLSNVLNATASLGFWIRTTQAGNDLGWQAPGVTGVELSGGADDIFWGWLDAGGRIGVSVGNDYTTKSTTVINDGNWHHVVLIRNHVSGKYRIYIDGALDASGNIATGTIGTTFSSVGRIEDTGGSPVYFNGNLDEVRVYGSVLSTSQVTELMNETHICSDPIASYEMDESDWSGAGAVLDTSGNGYHATALGSAAPDDYPVADPPGEAIDGDPGTCGAGVIPITAGTQAVSTPIDPNADIGNSGTIAFWYSHNAAWNDGNNRMLFDASNDLGAGGADKHFYLVKRGSGVNGGLRFSIEDSADTDTNALTGAFTFAADTWHHVAVTWNMGADRVRIFVDGVQQVQSNTNVNGTLGNTTTLYIGDSRGGAIAGTPGNYVANSANGYIDEVRIYGAELPQSAVAALMIETRPCTAAGPNHFEIDHDGTAVNCQAEPVTISAHDVSDNVFTSYTGTISLSTSTSHGDWTAISAAGTLSNAGNGMASYTFAAGDNGTVQLALKNTFVETLNINVADNLVTEGGTEDPDLAFAETGFIFLADAVQDGIGVQIAGKASNVAPGAQVIELQAVRTSDDTGACEAALVGANDVELRLAYVNPATGTQSITINGTSVGTGYTPVSMDFGDATDTTATLVLNYPDAGRIQLDAQYNIPLESGAPSGNYMLGSSNTFVVKPAGLCVESPDAGASCPAGDASCAVFRAAGATFSHNVRAVGWESAGETDSDFCTGNAVTPNFRLNGIALGSSLVAPAGGTNATLGVTSVDVVAADNGDHLVNDLQTVSEVGVFRITATPPTYLGEMIAASSSVNIGRFTPARLDVMANTPTFAHSCAAGADPFTYMDQPFYFSTAPELTVTGLNASGVTTLNYGGEGLGGNDFWRLSTTLPGRQYDDPARPAYGALNNGTASLAGAGDYDGAGTLTLVAGSGGDEHMYGRGAAVEAPFNADVDATFAAADLTDSDSVCYDPDQNSVCDTFTISDITGTGAGAAQQRFGRLVIGTAAGSELLPLAVPLRTEYFNGTAFVANTDDACTSIAATDLSLSSAVEGAQADGDVVIATGGSCPGAGCTTATVGSDPVSGGDADLDFSAPGEGFTGYAEITIDLGTAGPDWLRYDWDNSGAFDDDPVGRASFGVFGGNDRLIYTREPWN